MTISQHNKAPKRECSLYDITYMLIVANGLMHKTHLFMMSQTASIAMRRITAIVKHKTIVLVQSLAWWNCVIGTVDGGGRPAADSYTCTYMRSTFRFNSLAPRRFEWIIDKCLVVLSHYLNRCWPPYLSPYGVTRPQWVNRGFSALASIEYVFKDAWST